MGRRRRVFVTRVHVGSVLVALAARGSFFARSLAFGLVVARTAFFHLRKNTCAPEGYAIGARDMYLGITANFTGPTDGASSGAPGSLVLDGVCLLFLWWRRRMFLFHSSHGEQKNQMCEAVAVWMKSLTVELVPRALEVLSGKKSRVDGNVIATDRACRHFNRAGCIGQRKTPYWTTGRASAKGKSIRKERNQQSVGGHRHFGPCVSARAKFRRGFFGAV